MAWFSSARPIPAAAFGSLRYTPGVKGTVSWTEDNKNVIVKYDKRPEN